MSVFQLKTFADLVRSVRSELGVQSTDTTALNRIKEILNVTYAEIVSKKRWWWLTGNVDLTLPAFITAGTANVTQNSNVVTLTIAPASSKKGYLFALDGYSEVYKIESHAANSVTVKLANQYTGPTNATATYRIWTERLALPTDCKETVEVWHDFYRQPLDNVGRQEFRRCQRLSPRNEAKPIYYYTGDFADPTTPAAISSLPSVSTRSSSLMIKTIIFSSSIPLTIANSINAGEPVKWNISNSGHQSYNGDVIISTVSTTNILNDTVTYTGLMEYTESATSDSTMTVQAVNQEQDYNRYREIFFYPSITNTPITMHVEYSKEALPLNNDSDEPLIPYHDRIVLRYGALAILWSSIGRNKDESARNLGLYEEKLNQMEAKWQDSTENAQLKPSKNYLGAKRNILRKRAIDLNEGPLIVGGSAGGQNVTGTANSAAQFGTDGVLVASPTVSSTELGYLDGVTSSIQTQLNTKQSSTLTNAHILVGNASNVAADVAVSGDITITNAGNVQIAAGAIVNADINSGAAIDYSKLNLLGTIVNSDISASAAIADSKLATIATAAKVSNSATTATSSNTNSAIVARDGSGNFSAGTITAALSGNASTVTTNANLTGPITSVGNTTSVASQTGTGSKFVMDTSPVLVTPNLGTPSAAVLTSATGLPLTTGVTGQLPIGNGGTGQATKAAAFDALHPMTTTGDMIYASSGSTSARLGIGTSGQVIKQVGGVPTWATFSGGINYLSANPDAEADTSGWSTYADAAQNIPVDATGGSPSSTWTRTTSSPLRGAGSFLWTRTAANRQGEGVSFDFTIDDADKAKPLAITFDYKNVSGTFFASDGITVPSNDGTTTQNAGNSDLEVFIYDKTNAVLIPVSPQVLSSSSTIGTTFKGTFQTASNSTSYRIAIHTARSTAVAFTQQFDNFFVGPQSVAYGAPISDWTTYSITIGATTSVPTKGAISIDKATWRRVGDSMEIHYDFNQSGAGSAGTGTYLFPLPSGYTIDSAKINNAGNSVNPTIGSAQLYDGTNYKDVIPSIQASSTSNITIQSSDTSTAMGSTFGALSAAGVALSFDVTVPISGWSSTVQMSNDTDTRVVVARYGDTSTSISSGVEAVVKFSTKTIDTHSAYDSSTGLFTVPVSGRYQVTVKIQSGAIAAGAVSNNFQGKIYKNGSAVSINNNIARTTTSISPQVVVSDILDCVAGDTIGGYLFQDTGSSASLSGQGAASNYIAINRISGPSTIAATESVNARYYASATSLSGSLATISWTTKDYDSHGGMSAGTYTVPTSGKFQINAALGMTGTYALNNLAVIEIQKNGTVVSRVKNYAAAAVTQLGLEISDEISCVAGDTLRIQVSNGCTSPVIVSSNFENYISIFRTGN